jgi:hypothetical protein
LNKTKAYLDWNIILSLKNKRFSEEKFSSFIKSPKLYYPFSAAHIQEIDNISISDENLRNKMINEHLDYLSRISQNLYLYHDLNKGSVYLLKEKPHQVLTTIREVPFAKNIMKGFSNFISFEQRKVFRETLEIDSKQLNNYKPQEVVIQIDKIIKSKNDLLGLAEILETVFNSFPNKNGLELHNYIAAIFEMLDMIGYWRDEEKNNSNYARLWDSNYTFFASFSEYFISDDKRTRNKAEVVYSLFKIKTKILSSEDALVLLNNNRIT